MTVVNLRHESSRPSPALVLGTILVGLGATALVASNHPGIALAIVGVLAVVALLAAGEPLEKCLLLTLVVACLMPHEGFRRGLKIEEIAPLLAVFLLLILPRPQTARSGVRDPLPRTGSLGAAGGIATTSIERWALLLMAAAAIGLIHGLIAGRPRGQVVNEFGLFLAFGLTLVVVRSNLSERWIRYLLYGILACTAVVSFRYLGMFISGGGQGRAASDQQHLLNTGIPVLFAFLMIEGNWRRRILTIALLLPLIAAAYVTQTRAIWIYVTFSVVLLAILYAVHRHIGIRLIRTLASVAIIGVLAIGGYRLLTSRLGAGHEAISGRIGSMRRLGEDVSLAARIDLGFQAFARFQSSPIWGAGFGDYLRYRILPIRDPFYTMDSSYLWVIWKLGILGIVPFLILYLVFLRRVWYVYRHSHDDFQRRVAVGVFVSFVSLLFIGFESGILIIYRFNLVWAVLMGIFELWAQRVALQTQTLPSHGD